MKRFEMPIPEDLVSRTQRVLVVEDDLSVQRMLLRTLQGLTQIKAQACSGGLEALIAIGKEAPDLLVLDIRIPQVNGLEVCRVLKASEATRPIRIIAITGETLSQDEEGFLRQHADRLVHKPLSTEDFRRQVAELLELEPPAAAS
jgi:CheY-like chemotaxis protein